MIPELYRVERRRQELPDTVTLVLTHARGASCPEFAPGQFNMLYAPGVGEIPISLSGDPARHESLTHTIRSVGAVSSSLAGLKRGSLLGLRGPFGHPWPLPNGGDDVVVVAGGLGLAPLRPALYHLARHRARFRNVTLIYGARRPEERLFPGDLDRWGKKMRVEVTVDHADASWRGHVGVVTHLLPRLEVDPARTLSLVCGPEVMMRFAAQGLEQLGLPPSRIFVSLERNMHCGTATCGHCQLGPVLVCRDGPVFSYERIAPLMAVREL